MDRVKNMNIEITDDVMDIVDLDEQQVKEIIAVSFYQLRKINGVQGGKIVGKSEMEFHEILGQYGQTLAYDANDLMEDLKALKKHQ